MKREEEKTSFWSKVVLITIAVLFVGMMIISSWGMGWLTTFRTVQPLDTISMDYTVRASTGQVVLTTDQSVYQTAVTKGDPVFYTTALALQAGKTGNPPITSVPAYNPYVGEVEFALLGPEVDELGIALLGLHAGEKKQMEFQFEDPYEVVLTEQEFTTIGGNFSESEVGDWIPLGFSETPVVDLPGEAETPPETVIRTARIVEKNNESVLLSYRFSSAQVSFANFAQ